MMDEKNTPACVPFFAHENALEHSNMSNRRMLIALICVCVTFIITILVFVIGYTEREKNWLNTVEKMQRAEDAGNGVHEQPDP